jgi:alkylated DNA repair dioxygenase AlkB
LYSPQVHFRLYDSVMSETALSDLSPDKIDLILKKLHFKPPSNYDGGECLDLLRCSALFNRHLGGYENSDIIAIFDSSGKFIDFKSRDDAVASIFPTVNKSKLYPCVICNGEVTDLTDASGFGLHCSGCEHYFHNSCCTQSISKTLYEALKDSPSFVKTFCNNCNIAMSDVAQKLKRVDKKISQVSTKVDKLSSSATSPTTAGLFSSTHFISTCNGSSTNTIMSPPSHISVEKEFIDIDLAKELDDFVNQQAAKFEEINSSRDVMYFGEYKYKYRGASHDEAPIPPVIEKVIEKLQAMDSGAKINSCLISRYNDGNMFCPPHSDDEVFIDPTSKIFTLSIGAERTMTFSNRHKEKSDESLTLPHCSLLTFDRHSQDFWNHAIVRDETISSSRYSFTFRHLSPVFLNSTAIIGDSNTQELKFGEGPGTFGRWFPGKRVKAGHIRQIPEPQDIGPYRNIVIHTAINDINPYQSKWNPHPDPKPLPVLAKQLEFKCTNILKVYPRSNIYLSCVLPTKDSHLNKSVREFNGYLEGICRSHKNIRLIQHPTIGDPFGNLRINLGRQIHGKPNAADYLHLGDAGMKIFASTLKETVRYKKRSDNVNANVRPRPQGFIHPRLPQPVNQGMPQTPQYPSWPTGYPGFQPPPRVPPRSPPAPRGHFAGNYSEAFNRSPFQESVNNVTW